MDKTVLPDLAAFNLKANERILDNIGIRVKVPWIPEYVELRDRLEMMHPIRRWLSWRLRRRFRRLKAEQHVATFNAVIEASRAH